MEKNEQQMRGTEAKLKQEGIRLRSERPACPRREPPSSKPRDWLPGTQAEEVSESIWHPEELDSDLPLGWRTRIASQALCPREQISAPAGHAKGSKAKARGCPGWAGPRHSSPRCVDHAQAAYRRVDALCGSSHARGGEQSQERAGGAAHSPGEVCQWLCHSIDTARAEDRGGNCGCWPHPPRAGFHRLPCAARAHEASAKPGQRSVPSGWRAKSRPEKRPCFQGKATSGGPYPGTGEGVSTVSSCASGQAGANSVVRSGSG